jgi:TolA-binding protein
VKPLLAKVNNHKDLSKLSVKDSQKPETPKETALRRLNEKIELMRQEFEELQFLKQIAETLKSLRTRLINERWD